MANMDTKEKVIDNLDTVLHFQMTGSLELSRHELATIIEGMNLLKQFHEKNGNNYFLKDVTTVTGKILNLYSEIEQKAEKTKQRLASYYHD